MEQFRFLGWYDANGKLWDFDNDVVLGNTDLFARFSGENGYRLDHLPRLELPVSDKRPATDNSVAWQNFFPLLGAQVSDVTDPGNAVPLDLGIDSFTVTGSGADNLGQPYATAVNYSAVGSYQITLTANWTDAAGKAQTLSGAIVVDIADRYPPGHYGKGPHHPARGHLCSQCGLSHCLGRRTGRGQ